MNIPAFARASDGNAERKDLKPSHCGNLLFAFRRCHTLIAGTGRQQKAEAFCGAT